MDADEVTVGALKRLRLDVHQTDWTFKDLLDRLHQVGLGQNLQEKRVKGLHFNMSNQMAVRLKKLHANKDRLKPKHFYSFLSVMS